MKPRRSCPAEAASRAFTLIEVMVVVAIVGLTLMMGLPAFLKAVRKEGMRKAEYDMVQACQEARRAAIMGNKTTELIIHPINGDFSVPGAFSSAQLPTDVGIDILGVNFIESKNFDVATVHFHPNGTSDEFTIILHALSGSMVQISLDPIAALPVVTTIR